MNFGVFQTMTIVSLKKQGAYLSEEGSDERVLLPGKYLPQGAKEGDEIRVFLYRDSSDRPVATTETPALTLGRTAFLTVKDVTSIGAFLDWGLEKDLFLPFKEQTYRVKPGDEVLAALYLDKSGRLCATMKVYPYLCQDPPYDAGDEVTGLAYEFIESFGLFVAVDGKYSALLPKSEAAGDKRPGGKYAFFVREKKEDGKLTLSCRKAAYQCIDTDAEKVISIINEKYKGVLPFDDKASSDEIRDVFSLSKAAFKRAVGRLYKERRIDISDGGIKVIRSEK